MSSFVSGSSFRHTNLMSSSYLVSLVLAIVFAALAALHVYWAIAGGAAEVASAAIPTRTDGAPLFRPSARSTLAVAAPLVAAAARLGSVPRHGLTMRSGVRRDQ